jgi:hypothetical protein
MGFLNRRVDRKYLRVARPQIERLRAENESEVTTSTVASSGHLPPLGGGFVVWYLAVTEQGLYLTTCTQSATTARVPWAKITRLSIERPSQRNRPTWIELSTADEEICVTDGRDIEWTQLPYGFPRISLPIEGAPFLASLSDHVRASGGAVTVD